MKRLISFALLIIVFIGCQKQSTNKNQQSDSKAMSNAFFIPNPQVVPKQEVKTLEIGSKAPEFNLPGIDGKYHSISDYTSDVLIVLFTCNHCPTAQAYEDRVISFVNDYSNKSVDLVAISPNSPIGVLLEELGYSDLNDSFEEMKIRAKDKSYNFPYLYDGDNQQVSLQYGPVATPQAFVFNNERVLKYVGRLDGIEKPGTANAEDLRNVVDALLEGKNIENPKTKTFGCSTKWGWKTEMKKKVNEQWNAQEVNLSLINSEGIATLLKNDSENLRLLNIWATWCGPCKVEYPEFINVHRMYKDRSFEFISLSADRTSNEKNVIKFLESRNSAVTNYLFNGDDNYELIEAVDPNWDGALPYTLLIEPNGKIAWKHQGEVDFHELKKAIVEHELIGRYY